MRTISIFTILTLILSDSILAQKIMGTILDENKNPLEYASVILISHKDSTMVDFANSNRKGEFLVTLKKQEGYLLQVTYLGYETLYKKVEITNKDIVLEPILLKPTSKLMDVIEIKDFISPMTFGKDTIQYNAAAFKVKPGDMAEDLLRKLPGVEVERDGSVKALGEKVQNVLVDGKEFFGKDTKIATKNLDADAIDKVQVFDRKSDRSEFTGIDDGQKERTINLKLKDDKKVGYFGTLEGSAGTEDRFKGRVNVNRFTTNKRSSFIGMANNINEQNFSINDYIDFMGGIGALMSSGGGGRFTLNLDQNSGLPAGLDNNQGIQKSFAGGFNMNTDFSKKTSLDVSVFGNHFKNNLLRQTTRENLLPESRFISETDDSQLSDNTSGSFTVRLKSKLDSTQILTVRANGSLGNNGNNSNENTKVYNLAQFRQNDNINEYQMTGNNYRIATDILWQKKSKTKGRTYSLNTAINISDNNSESNLASIFNIYSPISLSQTLRQDQFGLNNGFYYKVEASITEPIGKKRYIELKSSLANQANKTSSDYFDIVNDNSIKNQLLSTLYQRDYTQRNVGANYILSREKYNLTLGSRYKFSSLDGIVNDGKNNLSNNFQAILPNAFFTYRFGMSENLNFNYYSELNEPSLQQLQPNINNSNPLSIYVGNPKLRPEQIHNTNLSFMRYNAFNFTLFYASLQSNYTYNKISESLSIDSSLVRSYTPVNTKNESTTSGRIEYDTPIRPLKIKARMILKGNFSQGISVINDQNNPIRRIGYGYNFSLENRNKDIIDFIVGYKSNRSVSKFIQNENLNQSYKENTFYTELGLNVDDWVSLKSNFDYFSFQPSFTKTKITIPLWTATATSFITKDKKLRCTISCFDLLNRNKGVRTNSQLNFTDITNTNVLGRYFLVGLSYNIKGFKKKSGIEINVSGRD